MTQQLDKLNRTDLVKLVAQEVLADMAGEKKRASQAVVEAAEAFAQSVVDRAKADHATLLTNVAAVVGADEPLNGTCITRVYIGEEIGDVATVIVTDTPESFDAKLKLTVKVPLSTEQRRMAREWQRALEFEREAEQRDTRVSTVKEKVRQDLVAELLKGPGGAELLAAAKTLAAKVKDALLPDPE